MKNSGEEKKKTFISEEMSGEGVRVEVGQHSKLQKSKIKKNPNKIKHTQKMNTSS